MTAHEKVGKLVEEERERIIEYLRDLVRIKSINPVFIESEPVEERQCQEFLAEGLREIGFTDIDLWEPDAEELRRKYLGKPGYTANRKFENRPNLVGRLPGSGGGRSIFLTGHIDVVGADPETEDWKHDPFDPVIENGMMYGRGSADMKGGVAAMMQAVRLIHKAGYRLKGDVLFGTVVDEETGSMGMLSVVDRGYKADAGIMTEPTSNQLSLLCRGIIWGRIGVRGKSGHIEVFQPNEMEGGAADGIEKGMRLLREIEVMNREWARRSDKRHPLLPRPNEINVSMIKAGQHPSAYAEQFEATVDIQYLPTERDENGLGGTVKREIEERLNAVAAADPWMRQHPIEYDWFVDADCGEVPLQSEIAQMGLDSIVAHGYSGKPGGSEFHTDMSLLTNNGTPTINIGPGDAMMAHQTNEQIPVDEYVDAVKIIARVIMDWCGYE